MCFRIKVVDSIDFHTDSQSTAHKQVIISFVMTGQDMYEELQEANRYRFYNIKPENFYRDSFRLSGKTECILL